MVGGLALWRAQGASRMMREPITPSSNGSLRIEEVVQVILEALLDTLDYQSLCWLFSTSKAIFMLSTGTIREVSMLKGINQLINLILIIIFLSLVYELIIFSLQYLVCHWHFLLQITNYIFDHT